MDPTQQLAKKTAQLEAELAVARQMAIVLADAKKLVRKHRLQGLGALAAILGGSAPAKVAASPTTAKRRKGARTEITPAIIARWKALLKKQGGNVAKSARLAHANEITFRKYTVGGGVDRRARRK